MKILHLTKKYPEALGGDAVVVYNLEKQQKKVGRKVFILTSNCPEIVEKVNVFKFGLKDSASNQDKITFRRVVSLFILLFSGFELIRKLKPDVIHSHSADLGFFISFSARLYRIPVVNTCHGVTFPDKQYGFAKKFAEKFFLKYGGFKKIITVDKSSLKFFKEAGINNAMYIPNGVDIEHFDRPKLEIVNNQKIRFLFVGRLEEQKGVKYLIQSAKILVEKTKKFEILLVGDGSQRKMLENLTKENNLENYVTILGRVGDEKLKELYCTGDVFILPSIWEGLPLTLLEAWSVRLPVIATNVGGIPEVCANEENALIIPAKKPEALANAMFRLIEDEKLRDKLWENGRKLVEEKYSWKLISKIILKIYTEVSQT